MNLKTRLNLVLAASAVAAVSLAASVMYFELRQRAIAEVQREAELHMEAAQALRKYTATHIRPLLSADAGSFHPESVPSFAATTTMRELHVQYPGVSYREVALNPTNPANLATGLYGEMVLALRESQGLTLQRQVHNSDGDMLYIAKALRVNDPSCLVCHSTPGAAPQAMRAAYPQGGGFGWQLGETVGAQVVAVPMTLPLARVRIALEQFLLGASTVVAAVFLVLNTMLRHVLLNPITSRQRVLQRQAYEDALTGAINRRGFLLRAEQALMLASTSQRPVSVVMIDIDHFKQINDVHGHGQGDLVLSELVQRVQARIRTSDVLGRLGGDEFALLLTDTPLAQAHQLADALRAALQDGLFVHGQAVGFSMGVAQWNGHEDLGALMDRADGALYAAKREGRGRVSLATQA